MCRILEFIENMCVAASLNQCPSVPMLEIVSRLNSCGAELTRWQEAAGEGNIMNKEEGGEHMREEEGVRSGGTVKCCRHLNSTMKDRWAYLNVLPETSVGSYKASQLRGGDVSIDWLGERGNVK